jgi:hypothetical protein
MEMLQTIRDQSTIGRDAIIVCRIFSVVIDGFCPEHRSSETSIWAEEPCVESRVL